jgi:hypothetical protein
LAICCRARAARALTLRRTARWSVLFFSYSDPSYCGIGVEGDGVGKEEDCKGEGEVKDRNSEGEVDRRIIEGIR